MELSSRVSPDLLDNQFTPYVSRYDSTGHAVLDTRAVTTLQQFFMNDALIQALPDKYFHALYSNFLELFVFEHKEKPTTEVAPEEEKLGLLAVYLLGIPLCLGTDIAGDESSIIWGIEKEQGKEEEEEGEEQEGMEEEPAALSMVMNQMMEEDYDYPADVPMDQEDEHNDSSEPRSVEQSEESEDDSENAPTDMSGIPSAVLEALKLAKSDKAICVNTLSHIRYYTTHECSKLRHRFNLTSVFWLASTSSSYVVSRSCISEV